MQSDVRSEREAGSRDPGGFAGLEKEIIDHFFILQPGYAVFLGLHDHDGEVPDLTYAATERWAANADRLLKRLHALAPTSLPEDRRLDRTLLELLLESSLFDLRVSHDLERNPMSYIGPVSLTQYMVRDYAPAARRTEAMTRTLSAVPTLLSEARRRLGTTLPEPFLRLTIAMSGGLPAHFEEAEEFAASKAPSQVAAFRSAREGAQGAVKEFLEYVEGDLVPKATPEFALGPEKFQRLLWVREGITTPTETILEAGTADLRRNQARLGQIARERRPPMEVPALIQSLFVQHPTAERLIPEAQQLVAETRDFVEQNGLATIPQPAICRVAETPSYGRALSTASMNPPGPFDETASEGIYFVTPVDPAWTPERQEEWLRSLNIPMLRNITVHEVFPGHYLQFLHFRASAGSLSRKVFLSASFTEGWAHYCEQLAIEAGIGHGSVEAEAAQLHDALLRDCRLIASIGLHTQGMTLEEATQLFIREAHMERLPAEREAIRGTFNPEYFCYTLGKLAILDAREKLLAHRYGGSLKAFHDRLLGFGAPPVGVLETLLASG